MTDDGSLSPVTDPVILGKIHPEHLRRKAIVYVRQSTLAQVRANLESQRRQYSLRDRLLAWGWPQSRVEVIDEDQGHSGSDSLRRSGFQRLVSEVALGRVGLVLSLETSRLTRSNEDWQRLLTICQVRDTLLADGEGIYSLRIYNDRMLLGLKGTVSEIELHTLQERMNAGLANKARRGELVGSVPVGYLRTEEGKIDKNPDEAVQGAIQRVFDRFREFRSVYATATALHEEQFRLPHRRDALGRRGVEWVDPSHDRLSLILTNPIYAGAYAWGRKTTVATVTPDGRVERRGKRRGDIAQWPVLLRGHHPGYISWEEFEENRQRIAANRRGFARPGFVAGGASLLAGLIRCGFCGESMTVAYGGRHHDHPHFICHRRKSTMERNPCQGFGGRGLERAIETQVLAVLEPQSFEAVLMAESDIEEQRTRQLRQWKIEMERAAEEEGRARRKFEEVEPGHRLVARVLEEKWEALLKRVEEGKRRHEQRIASLPPPLSEEERRELRRAVGRVGLLWRSPSTSPQQRKELVRLLVHHVEARGDRVKGELNYAIHWVTGQVSQGRERIRRRGEHLSRVRDADLTIIQKMAGDYTDTEIASVLAKLGRTPEGGGRWNSRTVKRVRQGRGWKKTRGRDGEWVTLSEAVRRGRIDPATLVKKIRRGELRGEQAYPGARWRIAREDLQELIRGRRSKKGYEVPPLDGKRVLGLAR